MASRNNVNDDDEELGAYIYQTSHTAKLFREKKAAVEALESPPSSHQTQRKSPRLLATKSKQQDIPTAVVPEKSTSNINTSIEQRAKRKKESAVLEEELDALLYAFNKIRDAGIGTQVDRRESCAPSMDAQT